MTLHNVKTIHPATVSRARRTESSIFYVLLTIHLSIFIFVINQIDAQNFCASDIITPIGVMISEAV